MTAVRNFLRRIPFLVRLRRLQVRGLRRNLSDLGRAAREMRRRIALAGETAEAQQRRTEELQRKEYPDQALVTVTFGSRYFGNPDNMIGLFLESFVECTSRPARIEILVKLDDDDDLAFFLEVKRQYRERVQLRFFPSPRGRGYEDMHLWHHQLCRHRSRTSRVNYILTDDAVFVAKGWDAKLAALLEARGDTYFIGTACSLETAVTIFGPNPVTPVPVYWIRGDDYPMYGFDLLASAAKVAARYPGWTEFGDLQLVDQYAGALLRSARDQFGVNLHQEIERYAERRGGEVCWSDSPARAEIRTRTLLQFFSADHQAKLQEVAGQIAADARRSKS